MDGGHKPLDVRPRRLPLQADPVPPANSGNFPRSAAALRPDARGLIATILAAEAAAAVTLLRDHNAALSRRNRALAADLADARFVSAELTAALNMLRRSMICPDPVCRLQLLVRAASVCRGTQVQGPIPRSAATRHTDPPDRDWAELAVSAAALALRRLDRDLAADQASEPQAMHGLTQRQRQIMALVLDGQPSKNIAADLNISQRTVENHRAAIMRRTGATSLPALARLVAGSARHDDCRPAVPARQEPLATARHGTAPQPPGPEPDCAICLAGRLAV